MLINHQVLLAAANDRCDVPNSRLVWLVVRFKFSRV